MSKCKWHNRDDYPEEDKKIVVKDKNGKKYKNHTWSGHCYYDWIIYEDGSGDGYPTDIAVVSWRYQ